ncbi:arginase (macronuclear) [Tetrahymena thermophila SB210]|uniref:Arginase n=1 Tax=Tetrahymena thermophila (strain SB210) TaxID=312017 RepID=Q236D2_TETTS|nr:arginase [Tetrahymena thermophila SB210]EAR92568.1 arginase [Tetrahymena thermophila SB210]|eukprot:XP_001012813.1 arginase [Tetrahymena thermophila SB210]
MIDKEQSLSSKNFIGDLIEEGLHGQISLIGFPYSIGAGRDNIYKGQENGPDCLRRFLSKLGPVVNPEYEISIENITISDYGNIQVNNNSNHEELIQKLQTKVKSVLNKKNIPIVIGGSKDCGYAAASPILQLEGKSAVINISGHVDVNLPYDGDKLSVTCTVRKIIDDNITHIQNKASKIFFFATQNQLVTNQQFQYVESMKDYVQMFPLNTIRRHQTQASKSMQEPYTQACQKFLELLNSLNDFQNIHISFSLESIHSSYCLGVSRMSTVGGLTGEEAIEIAFQAGLCKQVKGIDFTDFNPSNEDFRTGQLLGNLIYYFTMGYALRLKHQI